MSLEYTREPVGDIIETSEPYVDFFVDIGVDNYSDFNFSYTPVEEITHIAVYYQSPNSGNYASLNCHEIDWNASTTPASFDFQVQLPPNEDYIEFGVWGGTNCDEAQIGQYGGFFVEDVFSIITEEPPTQTDYSLLIAFLVFIGLYCFFEIVKMINK